LDEDGQSADGGGHFVPEVNFLPVGGPLGMLARTPAVNGKSHFMGSTPPAPTEGASAETSGQLFAACYGDLKDLAERQLRRSSGMPVSPTTLLHEAYLGMVGRDARFPDRARFMGYVARVMRGLIIDLVRERRALKRGSEFHITQLPNEPAAALPEERELVRLSDALDELSARDPRLAQLVYLKYFCGYSC